MKKFYTQTQSHRHKSQVSAKATRLKYYVQNWNEITQDNFVLKTIQGYKLSFTEKPHQTKKPIIPCESK